MPTPTNVDPINPRTGKPYTAADYKIAAEANIFFARCTRQQARPAKEWEAHMSLARMYGASARRVGTAAGEA